jgi:CDP-glucose 4,6-dehydratase
VLLTGHTGFKGGWLAIWLASMGAQVAGISLPPSTTPNLFELADVQRVLVSHHFLDIRALAEVTAGVQSIQPEVVFHLAAQPLVRRSYKEPIETYATNVMGTANILEALRHVDSVRVAVIVTTDKVYRNLEQPYPFREEDTLGGYDPYSASKAASEIVAESYRKSFLTEKGLSVASARAGNVIGGGDWSEDRLMPDAVRAWQTGCALQIRKQDAVRPWQHVLEPLCGYLVLAQALWNGDAPEGAYNFGPNAHEAASVRRVVERAQQIWGPDAKVVWGDGKAGPHEADLLTLDTARARVVLGVASRWGLEESVTRTMHWYRAVLSGGDAYVLCRTDIDAFEATV